MNGPPKKSRKNFPSCVTTEQFCSPFCLLKLFFPQYCFSNILHATKHAFVYHCITSDTWFHNFFLLIFVSLHHGCGLMMPIWMKIVKNLGAFFMIPLDSWLLANCLKRQIRVWAEQLVQKVITRYIGYSGVVIAWHLKPLSAYKLIPCII